MISVISIANSISKLNGVGFSWSGKTAKSPKNFSISV